MGQAGIRPANSLTVGNFAPTDTEGDTISTKLGHHEEAEGIASGRLFRSHRRLGCVFPTDQLGQARLRSKVLIPFASGPILASPVFRTTRRACSTTRFVEAGWRLILHREARGIQVPQHHCGITPLQAALFHGMRTKAKKCVQACSCTYPPAVFLPMAEWVENMEAERAGLILCSTRPPSFEGSRWPRLARLSCRLVHRRGYLQEHPSIWLGPLGCQIQRRFALPRTWGA